MRKIGMILTLIALLGLAAGCGNKPAASPAGAGSDTNIAEGAHGNGEAAKPEEVQGAGNGDGESDETVEEPQTPASSKLPIKVFFTDDNLLELQQISRDIEVPAGHSKYEEAFKALQTADSGLIALWEKVVLNKVAFSEADGQLTIDITLPDEARLGAGGESLALEALKNTMFQFDEVKQIELTVDGQQVESLMGHVDLEHPMTRS
ncbi:GerMN domain-containing protein [Paenibacillus macerans]|uniref:GerMN domain-containing protein n=1 Tax=Paenibacillus macerans TaxID=44252 RepID=UPI003D31D542